MHTCRHADSQQGRKPRCIVASLHVYLFLPDYVFTYWHIARNTHVFNCIFTFQVSSNMHSSACIRICLYIYIHTYIQTYIHTLRAHLFVCMYRCTFAHAYLLVNHRSSNIKPWIRVCVCTYIHVYIFTCVHTHIAG